MAATTLLQTSNIIMPTEIAEGIWKKAQKGSVIAALSGQKPQKYGQSEIMTFNTTPRAELVAEGASKSPASVEFGSKTVKPHKVQVTVRFNNEVQWADEDYQLGVLDALGDSISVALARALDLVAIHGINPSTGAVASSVTEHISSATNIVTSGSNPDQDVETAAGLIIDDGFTPTGCAFDTAYAWKLATARYTDGRKKYPEIGLSTDIYNFEGLQAATSDTVSALAEAASATNLYAIIGDWANAFKWGVQREIGVRKIEYGDPDGLGDLQRKNQIALRAEVVYGFAIMDLNAFALINKSA